jgi:O-antigen ligase
VDHGFAARLRINRETISLWKQSPLLGAGLGEFWREQQQLHKERAANVSHNTILWLASETGLLGLAVFGGFALACGYAFLRHARSVPPAAAAFGVTLVMLGASVGTEVLYQRYGWFFAGLGLACLPAARNALGMPSFQYSTHR